MNWKQLLSNKRLGKEGTHKEASEKRTDFQRDYDRLIFSAAFRRMQNKTQVFPLPGSVFVHNRLTHSLEVASVGRSLGYDVADILLRKHPELAQTTIAEIGAIVSAACLAHDMGNPPFGHSGERAIQSFFSDGEGHKLKQELPDAVWQDITKFDGNANTFRLLTHQFQGHRAGGLTMTYSTLAAFVKYPYASRFAERKPKFGYFDAEKDLFSRIADELGLICLEERNGLRRYARHPLAFLVEAADDICYEIMDIEDASKLHIISVEKAHNMLLSFFSPEDSQRLRTSYAMVTDQNDRTVYYRSCAINALEQACVRVFTDHEQEILEGRFSGSLIGHLPEPMRTAYEKCAEFSKANIYNAKVVTDIDLAGYHIIYTLMGLMTEAILNPSKAYSKLLLQQASQQYELQATDLATRVMAVLDYLSGMTDVYALDLYRKISGQSLPNV